MTTYDNQTDFTDLSINEFNAQFGTLLTKEMSFEEATKNIEDNNISYFYISMCPEDILNSLAYEREMAEMLKVENIFIKDLGIFVSVY